jgi:DNA polymerase-3 subunit delta'
MLMGPKSHAKIAAHAHPDLHFLRPAGKSATHPIENIRKLLDEAALPPFEAPVKIFIIEAAHQMLPYSSNALLKILEEPFAHTHFILLTPSLDAILPTIASRCRKLPFFLIPQHQIETLIKDTWNNPPQDARRIAFLSHGSLAKAKQLLSAHQFPWREPLLDLLSLHIQRDYPHALKIFSELETHCTPDEEEESLLAQADTLLEEILFWYRDRHLLKEGVAIEHLYHLDHLDRLKSTAAPLPPLESLLEQAATARLALQRNVRLKAVLEHLFLNL